MDNASSSEQQPLSGAEPQKLDLEALAQMVLEIMRRELLLESDRTGNQF